MQHLERSSLTCLRRRRRRNRRSRQSPRRRRRFSRDPFCVGGDDNSDAEKEHGGQSYNASTSVNYFSRVLLTIRLLIFTTLETLITIVVAL